VRVWDVRRRETIASGGPGGFIADAGLSPDGRMVAATMQDGGLEILSVPRLDSLRYIPAPPGRWSRFSRDGRLLIHGDDKGRTWLYDTRTWKPRGRPISSGADSILTADLSPDGRTLAITSMDGATRLWDVVAGRPLGAPLPGRPNRAGAAFFIRRGTHLVTVYDDGHGYAWDVRPASWMRHACSVAGRGLTPAEWRDILPRHDYAPACGP
jgi:WD40 repeat protein